MVGICTADKVTLFNDGLHYANGFIHKLILCDRTEPRCALKSSDFLDQWFLEMSSTPRS